MMNMKNLLLFASLIIFGLIAVGCSHNVVENSAVENSAVGKSCGSLDSVELTNEVPDLKGCTLNVGVENAYKPFNFIDTEGEYGSINAAVGYDYDIFNDICDRINCEPKFVETSWEAMVAVMSGQGDSSVFDVGANGITITNERAQFVDFSLPYITSSQVLLVQLGENRFTDNEQFARDPDLKIGTQIGTTNYEASEKLVGEDRIVAFEQFGLAVQALIAGDVDAVMIDSVAGAGYTGQNSDKVKTLPTAVESEELGFIFRKGSPLVLAVNWALVDIEIDGTGSEIHEKWFATDDEDEDTTTDSADTAPSEPLKIGYLADFSGPLAEFGPEIQKGVELAVEHINASGGVFGKPVVVVSGDTALQEAQAIQEARRLINIEGVAAIVGPLASGITLSVVESLAAEEEIPVISPSATSPQISEADDNDYLFRSTLSDAAQGQILAELVKEDGISNIAVLYINNAYGQGLYNRFEESFDGTISADSHEDEQPSYLTELNGVKDNEAEYLIAMSYVGQARVYLRESIENGIFEKFYFVDGTRSEDLITALGAENLEGYKGTVSSSDDTTDSFKKFNEEFIKKHGAAPSRPYIREAYDATIAIALAAESAKSVEGSDIRDALRKVSSPAGEVVTAGSAGVKRGIELVRAGTDINYEGAATSLDWNSVGDISKGVVSIWSYEGGEIKDIEKKVVELK